MARPWLKVHRSMLSNPRYGLLAPQVRLAFYELLLSTDEDGTLPDVSSCAWLLRVGIEVADEAVQALLGIGWLVEEGEGYRWEKWAEYQASETSTERVKKYRDRQKKQNETLPQRSSNTTIDLDLDLDLESPPLKDPPPLGGHSCNVSKNRRPTTAQLRGEAARCLTGAVVNEEAHTKAAAVVEAMANRGVKPEELRQRYIDAYVSVRREQP